MLYSEDQLRKNGAEAEAILREIKQSGSFKKDPDKLYEKLKSAVCLRLMIPEEEADTDDLRKLCILSIRMQSGSGSGLPESVIRNQIEKYDCHQTNLVTQKKVLLMLYIERILGVTLQDRQAAEICTLKELAETLADQEDAVTE